MPPIIEIKNLGKKYRLAEAQPYLSFRESISGKINNFFKPASQHMDFWALKDINLDIPEGERLAVIGRNGAGKSTLLKILSRITKPTRGLVTITGRVGSLLEVGTGFHNELTGKENIYLNGSILGLKKKEIDSRMDAIIDFSGVEKFIDTPLKNYSSGMQLRLAFSVAAHLEPEILLIDEVLAVGDMEFQKKCVGKMEEVSNQGRTILFVSHNLGQVKQICNKAILLENGNITATGTVDEVIKQYSQSVFINKSYRWEDDNNDADFVISEVALKNKNGYIDQAVKINDAFFLEVTIRAKKNISNSLVAVRFTNQENTPVYTTTNADHDLQYPHIQAGEHMYRLAVPVDLFTPGRYSLIIAWIIPNLEVLYKVEDVMHVDVEDDAYPATVLRDGRLGIINKTIRWEKI